MIIKYDQFQLYNLKNFVKFIAKECKKKGIILVVDEITSGFRVNASGVYKYLGYDPDIVVYGKAIANGFPLSAICGKKAVMSAATDTFMSSTMWTERVGFVAALATIKKFRNERVYHHLYKIGSMIEDVWLASAKKYSINLKIGSFKPLMTFTLNYGDMNNSLLTLFTQEMLRRGFIASSSVYVTLSHTNNIIKKYKKAIDEVFSIMSEAIINNSVEGLLLSNTRSDMFKRLTK